MSSESTDRIEAAWHIRFDLVTDPARGFDVFLKDEPMTLGTTAGKGVGVDLGKFDARRNGVSRKHLKLWPADGELFAVDLDSTNGTYLNNHRLKPDTPYVLVDGDVIELGSLVFAVRVLKRPGRGTGELRDRAELADALSRMAEAITSQLTLDDVLTQALKMALSLTSAREATIWLVDDGTKDLVLEAEVGIEDEAIRRLRLPVSDRLVSQVIESRKPLRANREPEGDPVKVKTGYVVEALLYLPLMHGSDVLGVMAVTHREPNRTFNARDERLLERLANFAAIAIYNARLYERLQAADRLKQEMIQNISHEFRTPLTYIVGYVGLLLDDQDRLEPGQAHTLEIVQEQAGKLTWLIKNFVALRSLDDIARSQRATNLRSLLVRIVEASRAEANKRGITLSLAAIPDLKPVLANRAAIYLVLDNLLSNALKFTEPGGQVTVRASLDSGDKVRVAVTDTGPGIPSGEQENIFRHFYQVDGSATREVGGAGLGLTVVKSIVEAHGGAATVSSEEGIGSTFAFTLPVADEADASPASQAGEKSAGGTGPEEASTGSPAVAKADAVKTGREQRGEAGESPAKPAGDDVPKQPARGTQLT